MEKRKTISTVFTLRSRDVGSARATLDEMSDDLVKRFEAEDDADRVYCLNVNFFELAALPARPRASPRD